MYVYIEMLRCYLWNRPAPLFPWKHTRNHQFIISCLLMSIDDDALWNHIVHRNVNFPFALVMRFDAKSIQPIPFGMFVGMFITCFIHAFTWDASVQCMWSQTAYDLVNLGPLNNGLSLLLFQPYNLERIFPPIESKLFSAWRPSYGTPVQCFWANYVVIAMEIAQENWCVHILCAGCGSQRI